MSDEIQRAALLAGFTANHARLLKGYLSRFASIVAESERETCAALCEDLADLWDDDGHPGKAVGAKMCAIDIRARK